MSLAQKLRAALQEASLPEDTGRMAAHAAAALEHAADKDAHAFLDHLFRGSAAAGALQELPPLTPHPAQTAGSVEVPSEPEPVPEPKPKTPRPAAAKPAAD